jgi:hypothetical protein
VDSAALLARWRLLGARHAAKVVRPAPDGERLRPSRLLIVEGNTKRLREPPLAGVDVGQQVCVILGGTHRQSPHLFAGFLDAQAGRSGMNAAAPSLSQVSFRPCSVANALASDTATRRFP